MPKIKTKNNCVDTGYDRIEQIKSTLCSCKSEVCKAEVYETWDSIFDPEE